jgi:predicted RNase H-like HicB family nuclease
MVVFPLFSVGSQGKTKKQTLENTNEVLGLYLGDEDVQRA